MTKRLIKCLFTAVIASFAAMSAAVCADAYELEKHSQSEIKKMYQKLYFDLHDSTAYKEAYSTAYPTYAGKLEQAALDDALDSVNFCRYLAGLPYDVQLDESYNELAQNAGLIIYINQALSHTPSKPAVMSDAVYELAYKGAENSNIGKGYLNIQSTIVEGYMPDTDEHNILKLGHRRWVLNPDMQKTGFGAVYDSSAMYAKDKSRKSNFTGDYIAWPPANMPNEFMGNDKNGYAYSVSLNENIYSKAQRDKVMVTLTSKLTGKKIIFNKNSHCDVSNLVGYFNINDTRIASNSNCIIFNPGHFPKNDVIDIKITGIYDKNGKERPISYRVSFFDLLNEDDYTLGFPKDNYEVQIGEPLLIKGYDHPLSTGGYRIWSICEGGGRLRDYCDMIQSGGNIYLIPKKEGVVYLYEGTSENCFDDIRCKVTFTHKHTKSNWIIEKKPTAAAAGYRYRECTICKKRLDGEIMPATSVDINKLDITVKTSGLVYTGEAVEPKVTIKDGVYVLQKNRDYTVQYTDNKNAGTGRLTITGKGDYTGSKSYTFKIEPADIGDLRNMNIHNIGSVRYSGKPVKINFELTDPVSGAAMVEGRDYTVSYKNNAGVGTAEITICGIGNYSGNAHISFSIVSPEYYNGPEQRDDVVEIDCNTILSVKGGDSRTEAVFIGENGSVIREYASSDGTVYTQLPEGEYVVWVLGYSCRPVRTTLKVGSTLAAKEVKIYRYGDVNRDGKINVTDITKTASFIKGKSRPKDEEQFDLADVSGDGKITVSDITKIASHTKGEKLLDISVKFDIPELA